jgi:hypothetical protein
VLQFLDGRVREGTALVTAQVPTDFIQNCNQGSNHKKFQTFRSVPPHSLWNVERELCLSVTATTGWQRNWGLGVGGERGVDCAGGSGVVLENERSGV